MLRQAEGGGTSHLEFLDALIGTQASLRREPEDLIMDLAAILKEFALARPPHAPSSQGAVHTLVRCALPSMILAWSIMRACTVVCCFLVIFSTSLKAEVQIGKRTTTEWIDTLDAASATARLQAAEALGKLGGRAVQIPDRLASASYRFVAAGDSCRRSFRCDFLDVGTPRSGASRRCTGNGS